MNECIVSTQNFVYDLEIYVLISDLCNNIPLSLELPIVLCLCARDPCKEPVERNTWKHLPHPRAAAIEAKLEPQCIQRLCVLRRQ